jgi:hypothetical protein
MLPHNQTTTHFFNVLFSLSSLNTLSFDAESEPLTASLHKPEMYININNYIPTEASGYLNDSSDNSVWPIKGMAGRQFRFLPPYHSRG